MILDERQKIIGRKDALLRMVPAEKCFDADDLPRAHVDLGLVVQDELAFFQCLSDMFKAGVHAPR